MGCVSLFWTLWSGALARILFISQHDARRTLLKPVIVSSFIQNLIDGSVDKVSVVGFGFDFGPVLSCLRQCQDERVSPDTDEEPPRDLTLQFCQYQIVRILIACHKDVMFGCRTFAIQSLAHHQPSVAFEAQINDRRVFDLTHQQSCCPWDRGFRSHWVPRVVLVVFYANDWRRKRKSGHVFMCPVRVFSCLQ